MSEALTNVPLVDECLSLRNALHAAFARVWEDGEYLRAECCGKEPRYMSGIFGSDLVECRVCGTRVVNILSPHVSPLLLHGSSTHIPTSEFMEAVGEKCWYVQRKETKPS